MLQILIDLRILFLIKQKLMMEYILGLVWLVSLEDSWQKKSHSAPQRLMISSKQSNPTFID